MKLTENHIVQAYKCCITRKCDECPLQKIANPYCKEDVMGEMLNIINRLEAENKALNRDNDRLLEEIQAVKKSARETAEKYQSKLIEAYKKLKTVKSEAIKEFAERFLKKIHDNHYLLSDRNNSKDHGMFTVGIEQAVNETKEEMAGKTE